MDMNIYRDGKYKKLFIIPVVFLIISLFFMTQLTYGMDFRGGSRITIPLEKQIEIQPLTRKINEQFEIQDLSIKKTEGLQSLLVVEYAGEENIIAAEKALESGNNQAAISNAQKVMGQIQTEKEGKEKAQEYIKRAEEKFKSDLSLLLSEETGVSQENYSYNSIGAALGARFLEQSQNAVIVALILIAILVFYFFRNPVISIGVFQAAVYDIIIGIGAAGLLGIPITLGVIAALLMLIGYSIDSDIMLTDRILKRKKGKAHERAFNAMKTGLTMTGTSIGAISVLFLVAYFTHIEILISISAILLIGLAGDIIATWFTNVPLILWYMERKGLK